MKPLKFQVLCRLYKLQSVPEKCTRLFQHRRTTILWQVHPLSSAITTNLPQMKTNAAFLFCHPSSKQSFWSKFPHHSSHISIPPWSPVFILITILGDLYKVKVKLSCYHYVGDKGRGNIAPTHSWPLHYVGWVVSVTPRSPPVNGPTIPVG
jgi:hypothetical protein